MTADLKQSQVAFFRFIQQFLFMILSMASFYFFDGVSLYYVFGSLFIGVLITFIILLTYCAIQFEYQFHFIKIKKAVAHRLLITDGGSYFINGMSTTLLLQIDVLLIDFLYGAKSVGIYLILWKIPNTLIMLGWRLSDPFAVIVAKKLKENKTTEVMHDFFSLEKKILGGAVLAAFSYLLLGQYVIEIWVGKENIPNVEYMYSASALLIILSVMQRLYLSVNYYTEGLATVTILQFIEIGSKCVFIVFFFGLFHELAPAIGWLVALLATIWIYRWNIFKVFR
jgi:O-antigen/teichoic acid export membrane protein